MREVVTGKMSELTEMPLSNQPLRPISGQGYMYAIGLFDQSIGVGNCPTI
jgi:hypothetical protein